MISASSQGRLLFTRAIASCSSFTTCPAVSPGLRRRSTSISHRSGTTYGRVPPCMVPTVRLGGPQTGCERLLRSLPVASSSSAMRAPAGTPARPSGGPAAGGAVAARAEGSSGRPAAPPPGGSPVVPAGFHLLHGNVGACVAAPAGERCGRGLLVVFLRGDPQEPLEDAPRFHEPRQ